RAGVPRGCRAGAGGVPRGCHGGARGATGVPRGCHGVSQGLAAPPIRRLGDPSPPHRRTGFMRWSRLLLCALLVLPPVGLAGCRRSFSYEKTLTVEAGAYETQTVDPPTREQKVTVTVSGATAPVNVYLVLEKDRQAAEDSLRLEKAPANVLEKKENV